MQVVAADVGAHLQPFEHFVVDVRLEVDLRDVVRLDDALLVVVAARKVVFGLGVAARKRQVEVVRLPEPGDQVEPVGVGHVSVGIADGLDISRAVDREAVLAVVVVDALVEDIHREDILQLAIFELGDSRVALVVGGFSAYGEGAIGSFVEEARKGLCFVVSATEDKPSAVFFAN